MAVTGGLGHGVRPCLLAEHGGYGRFAVSCPHRVELAVGVLQMGRYDSELRSHPSPRGGVSASPLPPHSTIHDTSSVSLPLYMPPSEIHVFQLRFQQYG